MYSFSVHQCKNTYFFSFSEILQHRICILIYLFKKKIINRGFLNKKIISLHCSSNLILGRKDILENEALCSTC